MPTCPTCGGPLADHVPAPPVPLDDGAHDGADAEPELLGLDPAAPGQPAVSASLRRPGVSRWWLGAVAAVLAVGAGAWAVGRAGSAGPDGSAVTERAAPTSRSDGEATDPSTDADDTATTGRPGTTDGVRIEEATTIDRAARGPILGRPVGWSLLLGSPFSYGGQLERLDLDSGRSVSFGQLAEGGPALIRGDRLLLVVGMDATEPTLRIVPLDDPTLGGPEVAMGDAVNPMPFGRPVLPGPDPDTFWLYVAEDGMAVWRLIRLSDGEQLDEVAVGDPFRALPVPGGGPEVVSSDGGGVYGRNPGNGYRFITGGRPLAVSDGNVLVESCSGPAACQERWLSVADGAPVDRPIPPDDGTFWLYVAPGSDRYLYGRRQVSAIDATVVLFDLETGRLHEAKNGVGGVATTPDGRIIAVQTDTGIELYDADQDRWFVVPRGFDGPLAFAFVSNDG